MKTIAYGNNNPQGKIEKITIDRRAPQSTDVVIKIAYCGICHSDIHTARGDWGDVAYPCVPGHEIIGEDVQIGEAVKNHKVGDLVGVGCMVNSCRTCEKCISGNENYCNNVVWTYASLDPIDGTDTKGGYSETIVVDQDFVIAIPEGMDSAKTAPLLCAGITMYSPLKHWGAQAGKRVGIIGLGGLGHMGIKLAKALGAEVYAITTSPEKATVAKAYGAAGVIVSTDAQSMKNSVQTFDLLIDTAPDRHDIKAYIELLKFDGSLVFVGPIATDFEFGASDIMANRRSLAGSGIGSIAETKEMLAFCKEHAIYPDIEVISPERINDAWEQMINKKMDHRYVIDFSK